MADEWLTLGDIVVESRGGVSIKASEYTSSGMPVLTKGDVKPFGRVEHGGKFVSADYAKANGWRISMSGDLIVTTRDLTLSANFLGLVSRIPEHDSYVVNQGATVFRVDESRIDHCYLVYWCCGPEYRQHIQDSYVGSTQIHIRHDDLFGAPLKLLPLSEQKAIAAVLGALDDKIDLNRRMSATLQAIAQAVFQSWFVDFDPVRAKLDGRPPVVLDPAAAALFPDSFQYSALGEIPQGWRIGTLGDLVQLRTDRVDATSEKDTLRYIALEDMPTKSIDLSSFQFGSAVNSSIIAFRKGDVLFGSMRPYFHKVGLAFFDGITRTTTFVLRPRKDCFRHFALLHFSSDDVVAYSTTASVGTTIPYVRWASMESYRIPIPPDSLLAEFDKTVSPLIQRIAAQGEESRTLAALRDTLLPKLLNGELSVKDLKIDKELIDA